MASDKKEYQAVLTALLDHSTLASLINKLNKVFVSTEDQVLRKGLKAVLQLLNEGARMQTKKTSPVSINLSDPRYKPLAEYCQKCISSTKPQWQILAERHGWAPKGDA